MFQLIAAKKPKMKINSMKTRRLDGSKTDPSPLFWISSLKAVWTMAKILR